MDGLGVVPQSLLREAHRETALARPFRPRIAIAMQGNTVDAQALAPLLELRRAVPGPHGAQVRKQGAGRRATAQNRRHVLAEMDDCGLDPAAGLVVQFVPVVADGAVTPVHIFGMEVGDVRLASGQVPAQFIEIPAFRILLAGQDQLVFRAGDTALLAIDDLGPDPPRDHGLQEPVHAEGKVVDAAQVNVGGGLAGVQHLEEMALLGFNHLEGADRVEGGVFDGPLPAIPRRRVLQAHDPIHDLLPSTDDERGISGQEVASGDLEIEVRLTMGLVHRIQEPGGRDLIGGPEAGLFARLIVLNEEDAVLGALLEHPVAIL